MRRLQAAFLASVLAVMGLGACSSSGGSSRTIEVDYHSDDFAGSFLGFYPREVTVKPGMTLKFHQNWTGEPHTVTFGSTVDKEIKPVLPLLDAVAAGKEPLPDQPPPEYNQEFFEQTLPTFFPHSNSAALQQDAAHPCYLKSLSDLPKNHAKPCTKAQQQQPAFTGDDAFYSSGFIPFEGQQGNTYEMKIDPNAKPGTYFYFCSIHGVPMSGKITIAKGAKLESQAVLNRRGKTEADRVVRPLKKVHDEELVGKGQFKGNLAGSGDDSTQNIEASVNEFTPRTINSKAGENVTWTFIGNHTISFNVPPYTPLFTYNKKGTLTTNGGLDKAKGGWPGAPGDHSDFDGPPQPAIHLDAGDFDGSGGLKSSGTGFNTGDTYAVTFTKAGTYPYACLIHPGMIGKVVVK
jgi:plastocyanin